MFLDCETTGLGDNAAIIEIALIPYIDGERKPHYQSYIRPHAGCTMDAKAFEINKIDPTKVMEFPDAKTVIKEILDFIDSYECVFALSGHNVAFDIKKFYKFFCRNGEYGNYHARIAPGGTCTMRIAKEVFKGKRNKPTGFSLEKLCEFFKIELIDSHSALPDIEATIKLYETLLPRLSTVQNNEVSKLGYIEMKRKYMSIEYVQINPDGDVWLSKEANLNDTIRRFIYTELDALYEQNGYRKTVEEEKE